MRAARSIAGTLVISALGDKADVAVARGELRK
jgi:hypothetical protein